MGRTDEGREELGGALNQALEEGRRALTLHPWAVGALALTLTVMVSFQLVQVSLSLAPVAAEVPFRVYLHGNSPLALVLILLAAYRLSPLVAAVAGLWFFVLPSPFAILFVHSTRAAAFQQDRKFLETVRVMMGILLRGVASRTRPWGEMQTHERVEPVPPGRNSLRCRGS